MKKQIATSRLTRCRVASLTAGKVTLAIILCLHLAGCRDKPKPASRIPTFPVKGQLFIDGAPAVGAMVKFYSAERPGRIPTAIVQGDGSYDASYYDNADGAPTGTYKLLVVWMQPPPSGGMPQDILRGQFLDPNNPMATVTVVEGDNRIEPIRLITRQP